MHEKFINLIKTYGDPNLPLSEKITCYMDYIRTIKAFKDNKKQEVKKIDLMGKIILSNTTKDTILIQLLRISDLKDLYLKGNVLYDNIYVNNSRDEFEIHCNLNKFLNVNINTKENYNISQIHPFKNITLITETFFDSEINDVLKFVFTSNIVNDPLIQLGLQEIDLTCIKRFNNMDQTDESLLNKLMPCNCEVEEVDIQFVRHQPKTYIKLKISEIVSYLDEKYNIKEELIKVKNIDYPKTLDELKRYIYFDFRQKLAKSVSYLHIPNK